MKKKEIGSENILMKIWWYNISMFTDTNYFEFECKLENIIERSIELLPKNNLDLCFLLPKSRFTKCCVLNDTYGTKTLSRCIIKFEIICGNHFNKYLYKQHLKELFNNERKFNKYFNRPEIQEVLKDSNFIIIRN